jgi:hypothetical protein
MRSCACDLLGVIHKRLLLPACLTQLCIMSCFIEQVLELIVTLHVVIMSRKCYMLMDGGKNISVVVCHYGIHESGGHLSRNIKMNVGEA